MNERETMVRNLFKSIAALAVIAVITGIGQPTQTVSAADMELVIGTGNTKGKLFAAGVAISMASVL